MSYSSRGDYQYKYQSKGHRGYQQKDYSKKYPERDYRDSSQRESDRQSNKDTGRKTNRSIQQQRNGPSIKIESKPRIVISGGLQRSQIRDHFIFNTIQIDPKHEETFIEVLRKYFDQQYGSVSHLSYSYDTKPGSIIMKLGFQNDSAAIKALERKINEVTITIDEKTVKVSAKPTVVFKAFLRYQDSNKKQKSTKSYSSQRSNDRERTRNKNSQKKDKKDSKIRRHSRSSSSQSSSRSSSSSQKKNTYQKNNKKYDRSTHSRREQASNDRSGSVNYHKKYDKNDKGGLKKDENQSKDGCFERDLTHRVQVGSQNRVNKASKKYIKLLFYGIPIMISAKMVDEFLQTHRDGKFVSKKELAWKKSEGSKFFNILQGQFEQKDAQKLLRTELPMQIDKQPFIVIDSELQDKPKYVQKLSQYQINIKFPKEVEPYYVMKSLQQCGKVIQVVSNNKFTESGLSDYYNVTFAQKEVCEKFKAIKKTSKGISIYEISSVDDFVPIYRPTKKVQQESEMEPQNQQISQRFSVSPFKSLSPMRSL